MSSHRGGLAPPHPETRVGALDVLELPRVGPPAAAWPDLRWRNGATYDRIASGSTEFLSRDPLSTVTRSPYEYVAGNPLNGTDPSGEWGFVDGIVGAVVGGVSAAVGDWASGRDVSLSDVAAGAAGGFVGGFVCPPGVFTCAGAVSGFVSDVVSQNIAGGSFSLGHATVAGVLGGGFGLLGDAGNIATSGLVHIPIGVYSGLVGGAVDTLYGNGSNGGLHLQHHGGPTIPTGPPYIGSLTDSCDLPTSEVA